jgi:hypothetical protein
MDANRQLGSRHVIEQAASPFLSADTKHTNKKRLRRAEPDHSQPLRKSFRIVFLLMNAVVQIAEARPTPFAAGEIALCLRFSSAAVSGELRLQPYGCRIFSFGKAIASSLT